MVAHPDDECVAYGTLLQRMREPHVVYATDGAPKDPYFWQKYGSREEYARLRQAEARAALACVGVKDVEFLADSAPRFGVSFEDQGLFRVLPQAFEALAEIVARLRPEALATLAYEGGHPDHDSCNLLALELGKAFGVAVWEAPLYHREPGNENGHVVQDYAYDYTRPAHAGRLNYEAWQWQMTGEQVSREFEKFLQDRQRAKQPAT